MKVKCVMLGTPPSYSGPNYIAYDSQSNAVVAFSGIFVNTNSPRGPFVAPSGVPVNTNRPRDIKENLLAHLSLKRRRRGGEGGERNPGSFLSYLLFHYLTSQLCWLNQH
jgi:hypothetical protein